MDNADLDPILLAHELEKAWELVQYHMDAAERAKDDLRYSAKMRMRLKIKADAFDRIIFIAQYDPAAVAIKEIALKAMKEFNSLCAKQDKHPQ